MKAVNKTAVCKIAVCILCIGMTILCEIYMRGRSPVMYYISVAAVSVCAPLYCIVDAEKHSHVSRTLLVGVALIITVVCGYVAYTATGLSDKFEDFDALAEYIRGSGFWGVAIFIGLTVFQVVVLPIPEAVTILLGVAIYGATYSFLLSVIGTIIGSLISFMLGKVFGRKLCNWMFGAENTEKYAAILNKKGRFLFIIMLLFPAFPDDMLCMIAGITTMSYAYFTVICLITRPVMIGLTAYLGSGVIPFSGWGIPVWISIVCLLFVLFVVVSGIKSKIEKRRAH